ncbi:MAG: hypothetical protein HC915_05885 [Anaerolineae bacterium]|nr:hypothetical protein [Anaerolineae bacterium]
MKPTGDANSLTWGMLLGGALTAYALWLRPRWLRWGTVFGEPLRPLPGDAFIPQPDFELTHAVDVDAPLAVTWRWLAQMGQDGNGFYSLDVLTNNGRPSINYLRRDLPLLSQGQVLDNGLKVLVLEPEATLVLGDFNRPVFGSTYGLTLLYCLEGAPTSALG